MIQRVVISLVVVVALMVLLFCSLDYSDHTEQNKYYCEQTYGMEFRGKWDYKVGFYKCVSIEENGDLIEYYMPPSKLEELCENKFWKLNDCPDLE